MVSEFRKKKLLHVYYAFFDTNRSGSIDKTDFDLSLEKIAKIRGYKPEDFTYKFLKDILEKIWEGLKNHADQDGDGEISVEEWVKLWDEYAKNPDKPAEWQELYSRVIFQLEDATNDGAIDCDEFATVYESFGLDREESVDAFKKMAKGKDKVNWEEFKELWKEYFVTENPELPGNFIFGCYICSISHSSGHGHSHAH